MLYACDPVCVLVPRKSWIPRKSPVVVSKETSDMGYGILLPSDSELRNSGS